MPEFKYVALNEAGKKIKGTIIAGSIMDLDSKLENQSEYLISFREIHNFNQDGSSVRQNLGRIFTPKIPKQDLVYLFDQLHLFIDGGFDIVGGLNEIRGPLKSRRLSKLIDKLVNDMESGIPFYDALKGFPSAFDSLTVESVRIGEESGNLVFVLQEQARRMEKEAAIAKKVKNQSVYPGILGTIVVALLVVMNQFVLPRLVDSFTSLVAGEKMPPKTSMIMSINQWLMDYGLAIPIGIVSFFILWKFSETFKTTKWLKDSLKLKIPVVERLVRYMDLARVGTALQIGIDSGMQLSSVLHFLERNVTNMVIKGKIRSISNGVLNGSTLSMAVRQNQLDPHFTSMVSVGESTGQIPYSMDKVVKYYTSEMDELINTLFTIGSVLVIGMLGLIVGFCMMSIIIPIYELPTAIV